MKLLVVTREFPPTVGGMDVHAVQIARFLARRHDVSILAPKFRGVPTTIDSIPVTRGLAQGFAESLVAIVRAIRATKPDVIFVLNAGYAAIGRFTRRPVVARVVGNDFYASWVGPHLPLRFIFWRLPVSGPLPLGAWFRRQDQHFRNGVVARGLNSSRVVLANSNFTKRALEQVGVHRPRVTVQVGGVDLALFSPGSKREARERCGLPHDKLILTTSARLKAKKGIDTALRAISLLAHKRTDLLYIVLGSGEAEASLRQRVRELRIEPFVHFLGMKSHSELPAYLTASDLYVQPSRTATDPLTGCLDVETMGRAACEASSCGVPVIATTSGGLPDVVQDERTGLLVPEDDADALGSAIERLANDQTLRRHFGVTAAAYAHEHFGWDTIGESTERSLLGVVETSS